MGRTSQRDRHHMLIPVCEMVHLCIDPVLCGQVLARQPSSPILDIYEFAQWSGAIVRRRANTTDLSRLAQEHAESGQCVYFEIVQID